MSRNVSLAHPSHRALFSFWVLFVLCLLPTISHAQLLTNPGFEGTGNTVTSCPAGGSIVSGKIATGWTHNTCSLGSSNNVTFVVDPTNNKQRSGMIAQGITVSSGRAELVQNLPLVYGQVYKGAIWLRTYSSNMIVELQLRQTNAPNSVYISKTITLPANTNAGNTNNGYIPYVFTGSAEGIQGSLVIIVRSVGTLWIDDASLTNIPDLLANPGFEGSGVNQAICAPRVTGSIASNWADNTCFAGSTGAAVFSIDPINPHRGSASQKIVVTSGPAVLVQSIPFLERMHSGSVWLRAMAPMTVRIELRQSGPPYNYYAFPTFTVTTTWAEYKIAGLTGKTQGLFIITAMSPGTLWMDDASLETLLPTLPTVATPAQYFGMHIHRNGLTGQALPNPWSLTAGAPRNPINSVHLWDSIGAKWNDACRTQECPASHLDPKWNWVNLDAHVNRALSNGAELTFTLGGVTPTWASARPSECSPWNSTGGHSAEPSNDQYWRNWVTAVGNRYKGKIKYWEIWNEPTFATLLICNEFFTGTPEKLKSLAQQARDFLKQIDATNKIISPSGVSPFHFEKYLEIGGSQSADIIAYHFYSCDEGRPQPPLPVASPEASYLGTVPLARALVDKYDAANKPIWNTEEGRLACPHLDDQLAAAYLARSFVLKRAANIDRYHFYAWDNTSGSVIDLFVTDPVAHDTLTAAGVAYREVASWLIGKTVKLVETDANNTWKVEIKLGSKSSYIVWNPTSSASFMIPSGISVKKDLSGGSVAVSPNSPLTIGSSPFLLD
jgi:hypothetical protein